MQSVLKVLDSAQLKLFLSTFFLPPPTSTRDKIQKSVFPSFYPLQAPLEERRVEESNNVWWSYCLFHMRPIIITECSAAPDNTIHTSIHRTQLPTQGQKIHEYQELRTQEQLDCLTILNEDLLIAKWLVKTALQWQSTCRVSL